MITTVLLDLDDTILADDLASEIAFNATAAYAADAAGIDPERLIAQVKHAADIGWDESPFPDWLHGIGTGPLELLRARFEGDDPHWAEMRTWGPGYRRGCWIAALAEQGITDDALAETLDLMFENERGAANPWCDGAEQALTWLAERYQLGMVTNGIPDVQRKKIDATGIAPLFASIVVSGEIGHGKPTPEIFQHALQQLNANPAETIMVGDNWRRDAHGPTDLDIRGVWLSMGRPAPDAREPWLTVATLADLVPVLETMIDQD